MDINLKLIKKKKTFFEKKSKIISKNFFNEMNFIFSIISLKNSVISCYFLILAKYN